MTRQEFMQKLRETPRDWHVGLRGEIRNSTCHCPIEAVAGNDRWVDGMRILGIDGALCSDILVAADRFNADRFNSVRDRTGEFRRELIEACGMSAAAV